MVGLEKFIGFGFGQGNDDWTGKVDMFTCSGPRTNVLATPSVPKFLLVSRIGSLKFNPEGDAILFVSGDLWVEKNVQNLNLSKSQNPRVTISKLTQNSCFPSFCSYPI